MNCLPYANLRPAPAKPTRRRVLGDCLHGWRLQGRFCPWIPPCARSAEPTRTSPWNWFGTAEGENRPLTRDNLDEVAYASNRMLHTGPLPGTIGGQPYIDASYTCLCPGLELAERGYRDVVVIGTELGPVRPHLFTGVPLPSVWKNARLHFAQPPCDLAELGVNYTSATPAPNPGKPSL
ncbi:MAG: hypothetical protein JOY92_10025 [Verrucomicrobia bacterium]|nr:hypothetical protein [Verrucomicrobiota bacterium]